MDLTPASELSLRELSTLFARSFEGYFVTVPDAPLLFDARVRTEHISLEDSFLGAGFTSQALTQLELAHSLSL